VIEIKTKKDAINLRWFQKAIKKTTSWGKGVLRGIFIREDGTTISVDGYRLHQGPTPPALEKFAGKVIRFNGGNVIYKSPDRKYATQELEGKFPSTDHLFPQGLPDAAISIDKEFLMDAIEMPNEDGQIVLEFYRDEKGGLLVVSNEETDHRAIIMHMKSKKINSWKKSMDEAQKMVDYLAKNYPNVYGMLVNVV